MKHSMYNQYFFEWGGEKEEALPESRQTFEIAAVQSSGEDNLALSLAKMFFFRASIRLLLNRRS